MKFSKLAKESIKFYVYGLVNPIDDRIFYVGKASANNRAFDHLRKNAKESRKTEKIQEIRSLGKEPRVELLRYGLETESIAFEVEAAIIDAIGLENLTNEVRGHGVVRGRTAAEEIELLHGSEPIEVSKVTEPCMLFYINETYSITLSDQEIYDSTRQFWQGVSKDNRENLNTKIALAIVDGVVVRVYSIAAWFPAGTTMSSRKFNGKPDKWEFVGQQLKEHPLLGRLLVDDKNNPIKNMQKGYSYLPRT
ncbi:LEM-3-like GIY-YIG domain-containing protein [Photobacterium leiognathi]|uniref:LEM-3-like GIY-YIG domain-containing protein n=1 Tax=Photobacterium leiognathi TaxID=553611 RepID=UPI0029815576|nr:hypothetical protein [Photobacterium leiognathi]